VIYFPTATARYSLFVLKVPLNAKQTNIIVEKQTKYHVNVIMTLVLLRKINKQTATREADAA